MPMTLPGPAYRIETRRMVLRCWNPVDAPLLKAAVDKNHEHLKPWMPWAAGEPEDLQVFVKRLRLFRGEFDLGQDFIYGIFNLDESQVLGGTGLHTRVGEGAREIGYWIDQEHINQGLATEVSAALTQVAFELEGVQRVEIHVDPANVRSASVPKKLGYTHEATLRSRAADASGKPHDMMVWTLFADEYPGSPSVSAEIHLFDAMGRKIERTS